MTKRGVVRRVGYLLIFYLDQMAMTSNSYNRAENYSVEPNVQAIYLNQPHQRVPSAKFCIF